MYSVSHPLLNVPVVEFSLCNNGLNAKRVPLAHRAVLARKIGWVHGEIQDVIRLNLSTFYKQFSKTNENTKKKSITNWYQHKFPSKNVTSFTIKSLGCLKILENSSFSVSVLFFECGQLRTCFSCGKNYPEWEQRLRSWIRGRRWHDERPAVFRFLIVDNYVLVFRLLNIACISFADLCFVF